jgi:hypothetical protein
MNTIQLDLQGSALPTTAYEFHTLVGHWKTKTVGFNKMELRRIERIKKKRQLLLSFLVIALFLGALDLQI